MNEQKMKAWFLVRNSTPDKSFEIRDIPLPDPGSGQVRIKIKAFGVNYADIMARQGLYRECPPLPCVIGYEVEGTIDAVGQGVSSFNVGDNVFALTRFGGYAQYAVTSVDAVAHLPSNAPLGVGCALSTQCVTAYHASILSQTLLPGEKVMIHAAAGGMGTALMQIALWKGCKVIAIVGGEEKERYVRALGAHHVVDHHKITFVEYAHQHLNRKVDVVFDNVGGSSLKKAKSILAPGGRIVTLGAAALSGKKGKLNLLRLAWGFGFFSPISFLGKSQSLIGVNMLKIGDHRPDMLAVSFRGVEELYNQGILQPHIDKVYQSDELHLAHAYVEGRKTMGKVVVKWT
jgi:NADPH2:quinone reductase